MGDQILQRVSKEDFAAAQEPVCCLLIGINQIPSTLTFLSYFGRQNQGDLICMLHKIFRKPYEPLRLGCITISIGRQIATTLPFFCF